jgi:threonine synthase
MYMDESTTFSSIAGTLTSALLHEEFSPVVCERIAASAFDGQSPQLTRLDDRLFSLELYHGPTGCHKDFAFSWFASALEHLLIMDDREAIVLAATAGTTGRSLAAAFSGKKRLKLVLVYAKGTLSGLDSESLAWNGGNIWPVEVDGDLKTAQNLVRFMYSDPDLVRRFGLTLANTMNIGRLLPQVFFYMYAFTRIRKHVRGDIFYSVPSGNFGNLVAGLYAWKFSLPVNGFITDASAALSCDAAGRCLCMDSIVPLSRRGAADPASPSNIERLEQVFELNPMILKGLVFPAEVSAESVPSHMFDFYRRYGKFLDSSAASAYGAMLSAGKRINADEGTVILVSKDHPAFEADRIRSACGAAPDIPPSLLRAKDPVPGAITISPERAALEAILSRVHAMR